MFDGAKLDGPASLRRAILNHSDAFLGTFTENLLSYATGRVLEPSDMPFVRAIERQAARKNDKFSAFVIAVVESGPFRMRRAGGGELLKRTQVSKRNRRRMYITKKHLSRRTVLRGMGVSLALPFLDSMVPAQTPLSSTAANPKTRLACIEIVHGAAGSTVDGSNKHYWSPEKEGRRF